VEERPRKGLPGVTGILAERAKKRVELEVFGNIEEVLEKCRAHLLNSFQKGKEVSVEYELSEYILRHSKAKKRAYRLWGDPGIDG